MCRRAASSPRRRKEGHVGQICRSLKEEQEQKEDKCMNSNLTVEQIEKMKQGLCN